MGGRVSRVWLGVFALFCAAFAGASPALANSKYAAYVIHANSGDVLFDRYSTGQRYPASLTKMMTLYMLFEELEAGNIKLTDKLTVSATAAGQPPSKLGLKAGATIDVETAINALVVKSANDVAVVVAEKISGAEWKFAREMTAKARQLGMSRTTFRNASGLPNSRQVTTARDMAVLGQRVVQDFPQYFEYFAAQSFTFDGRTYRGHNSLVKSYDGADGLKTGYTRASGYNLVTTAERDGQRLIGVVLGGRSGATRDRHMRNILDTAFVDIKKRPALIAALHRNTPNPRLKPTSAVLIAMNATPTIADNDALRKELIAAAAQMTAPADASKTDDTLGALIAFAETDDYNEFQIARLTASKAEDGFVGEGDREAADEFSWDVQIGAYKDKLLAQQELEAAVTKAGLTERARAVLPTVADGSTLYRARVTMMTEIEAATACEALKDKGVSCFVTNNSQNAQ